MGKKSTPATDEIDEIFKSAKNKPKKTTKASKSKDVPKKSAKKKTSDPKLKIYTEEELNIGKGGMTDKCPFDCDCCF